MTKRQRTGTRLSVPIPPGVAEEGLASLLFKQLPLLFHLHTLRCPQEIQIRFKCSNVLVIEAPLVSARTSLTRLCSILSFLGAEAVLDGQASNSRSEDHPARIRAQGPWGPSSLKSPVSKSVLGRGVSKKGEGSGIEQSTKKAEPVSCPIIKVGAFGRGAEEAMRQESGDPLCRYGRYPRWFL